MSPRATAFRFGVLLPAVLLIVASTTLLGPRWIDWRDILSTTDPSYVFWHLRVPRTLLAATAGAGLAVGGVIFQALFRNPLAEPYTLGVAGGASLAAALGFLCGWRGAGWTGVPWSVMLAFGGALGALGLVYLVSRLRPGRDMARLLLAGVCVAYMCSAGILLVTFLADRAITNEIVVWMMGSLGVLRPRAGLEVAFVLVPVLAYGLYSHRALDLLTFGDDLAAARGVNVGRTVWSCFVLTGLLTGVIVANCGPIGFVGLMVPHIGRAMCGARAAPLLIGAALVGAAFLAVCDGLARSLPVVELPVGVVTNILGAAFFFYLLATREMSLGTGRAA
jgi:iron complex transport system permease protein